MKYNVCIKASANGMSVSFGGDVDLPRARVKSFFNPSNHIFTPLVGGPPDLDKYLEVGSVLGDYDVQALQEDIDRKIRGFELEVILPDSLRIWMEDLTKEYTRLSKKMPAEKLSGYEARYNEIKSMTNKEEAVRKLYSLVEEMKP